MTSLWVTCWTAHWFVARFVIGHLLVCEPVSSIHSFIHCHREFPTKFNHSWYKRSLKPSIWLHLYSCVSSITHMAQSSMTPHGIAYNTTLTNLEFTKGSLLDKLWGFCCEYSWWYHQREIFSVLLALCEGNPSVTVGFPSQRPVTRSFDVFFDLPLNKQFNKQLRRWWFEMPSCSLWCYCNIKVHQPELSIFLCWCSPNLVWSPAVSEVELRSNLRADSRFAPSQWEMALICNDISHWLGASLESALKLWTPTRDTIVHP